MKNNNAAAIVAVLDFFDLWCSNTAVLLLAFSTHEPLLAALCAVNVITYAQPYRLAALPSILHIARRNKQEVDK